MIRLSFDKYITTRELPVTTNILMKFLAGIFQVFITLLFVHHTLAFDPNQYPQKTVLCPAVRRLPKPETVHVELSIYPPPFPRQ